GRSPAFFTGLLAYGGQGQHVVSSDPRVKARLHDGAGGTYVWVANPARQAIPVRLTFGEAWGPYATARTLWGAQATVEGRTMELLAGARDVAVIGLE
ncbi:MAG: hypothetical protein ACK2UX_05980, partial [Anaerolineae bacterium]